MRTIFILMSLFVGPFLLAQSPFSFGVSTQIGLSGRFNTTENKDYFGGSLYHEELSNPVVPAIGAGGWVEFASTNKVSFRLGLQYVNSGNIDLRESRTEVITTGQLTGQSSSQYSFRVHQLQLPLEMQIGMGEGRMQPYLFFGAQLTRDWIGTIYNEIPYLVDNEWTTSVMEWSPAIRVEHDPNRLAVQAVLGFGLRLNDQMSVRVRHSWQAQERDVTWREDYTQWEIHTSNPGLTWCGLLHSYQIRTIHRRLTSLEFSYRLF